MVIIYEELQDTGFKFIRLNFESGKFTQLTLYGGYLIWQYFKVFRELGYTFIHR